jgi:Tn3 transposase DDE domain
VKYTDLLANALILHNVVDMSVALERLAARGYVVTPETVSALSPYTTRNWKRFGEYEINVAAIPPPLSTLTRLFHERFGNTLTRLGDPRTGVDSSRA